MHTYKDSMWQRILKNFGFLGGSKQGLRSEGIIETSPDGATSAQKLTLLMLKIISEVVIVL